MVKYFGGMTAAKNGTSCIFGLPALFLNLTVKILNNLLLGLPVRHTHLFLACFGILFACQSQAQAEPIVNTAPLCHNPDYLPAFQPISNVAGEQSGEAPADIFADRFDIQKTDESVFEGNVEMRRGNEWLGTERLRVNHTSTQFQTEGLVRYQNNSLRMTASEAHGDQSADTIALNGLEYQFHASNGNGSASGVRIQGETSTLTGADFSTCPRNEKQWQFVAEEIVIDDIAKQGKARNVKLKIGNVPVLWLPYMRFPTESGRSSGVLMPKMGQDSLNGFDFALPIYLNLAPNYDATLTPRYFSSRGFMLGTEFRYLFDNNSGIVNATTLPSDRLRNTDRYAFSWQHFTAINRAWNFQSTLNKASDVFYFSDFGESINETSTALLKSELGFHGRGKYWNLDLTASNWEIANPAQAPGSEPYRRLPRIALQAGKPFKPWLEVGFNAEAVAFSHDNLTDGRRFDFAPYVKFPITGAFWYATPKFSWRHTEYWLDDEGLALGSDKHLTRQLPIISFDAGAQFERNMDFAGLDFIQTLEPRLFYLKAPFRDQSDLPVFDTQALTFMWPSLFRENRYGGADRQTDANQLTLAVTSRFLDANTGKERLNFSLGRISYFDAPRVTLPGEPMQPTDGSAWVAEANVRLSDQWQIGLTQHWNPTNKNTEFSAVRGYWSLPNGLKLNAGYRYRAGFAEQSDFAFVIPINTNWSALGRWNFSLRDNQNLESLLGFEWRSCCMAFRVFGRKYIRSFDNRENVGIFMELELNGLGQVGSRPALFEDNGILAY